MSFEQFSRSRTYFCDGYELQHQEEFVIEQKSFLSSFPLSSKNVSHTYRAKSFAVVELKLHLYFLEESFIKAWRLRQAHNYIKAHRKQIPLPPPQKLWCTTVGTKSLKAHHISVRIFFPTTVVVIQFIRGSCLSIGANIELSANGICQGEDRSPVSLRSSIVHCVSLSVGSRRAIQKG